MNEGVKSISLDEIGESPKPIGLANTAEKALANKTLQYTPQYGMSPAGDFKNFSNGTLTGTAQGTKRRAAETSVITSAMSRISDAIPANFSQPRQKIGAAVVAGIVILGGAVYVAFGDQIHDMNMGHFLNGDTTDNEAPPAAAVPVKTRSIKSKAVAKAGPTPVNSIQVTTPEVKEVPGNPYWKLPNPVASASDTPGAISPQQTEAWRGGLSHPFNFQRYKATEAMRRAKIYGSVSILYEAIAQPKFWTRMEALLGIAEQGVMIDTESMRAAIGDARSDLVRNYFRRFKHSFGDGIAHVMRQALRVVEPKTRLLILSELASHRSETNDIYLIAATFDADAQVKAFASRVLEKQPPAAGARHSYDTAIATGASVDPKPRFPKAVPTDIQVEKIPANLNVEDVYFINDDEANPVDAAPSEKREPEVKEDDGFNDLNPSQTNHIEAEKIK